MMWGRLLRIAVTAMVMALVLSPPQSAYAADFDNPLEEYVRFSGGADDEAELYDRILRAALELESEVDASGIELSLDEAFEVYHRLRRENPALFYLEGSVSASSYGGELCGVVISLNDGLCGEQSINAFVEAVKEAEAAVPPGADEFETAHALHDYLVSRVAYSRAVAERDADATAAQCSAYGALVDGDAVCSGYADAYSLLLSRFGIESEYMSSKAMRHVWNLVRLDGTWYHVDVTWDDPTPDREGVVRHEYFLLSDEEMRAREHQGWASETVCAVTHPRRAELDELEGQGCEFEETPPQGELLRKDAAMARIRIIEMLIKILLKRR